MNHARFLFDPISISNLTRKDCYDILQKKLRHYLLIKTITSFITAFILALYLLILGYKFVFFVGLATFILNYIPTFGSLIATLLLVPIFGIEAESASDIIIPMIFPAMTQFIIGNILEPKFMGDALKLSPVTVIFSLIFWSIIFGTYGLFLGVPLSLVAFALYESSDFKDKLFTS